MLGMKRNDEQYPAMRVFAGLLTLCGAVLLVFGALGEIVVLILLPFLGVTPDALSFGRICLWCIVCGFFGHVVADAIHVVLQIESNTRKS